jgi:hypothetical protein
MSRIINTTPIKIIIKPTNRPIKAFVDSLSTNFFSKSLLVDGAIVNEHIRSSGFLLLTFSPLIRFEQLMSV